MEILVIWLAACGLVGYIASTKGKSGIVWFLASVLLSPLIMGIAVLVVKSEAKPVEAQQTYVAAATGGGSVADEIGKLAALRDSGALTTDEFERQKAALLARPTVAGKPAAPPVTGEHWKR